MDHKIHKKLAERREKGTLRSLSSFDGFVDFASNDYLGLARKTISVEGGQGATGSRLITGNRAEIDEVENRLADFFEAESALCFNSGYDANVGIFSSIPQRGDIVLYDEYVHASVRDGLRMSWAKSYAFKHNNLQDLERLLEKYTENTVYIAVEGLYSMEGTICPLGPLLALAERFQAYVILDEAHSGGVFGEDGKGLANAVHATDRCFLRLLTFGKAYGAHGAVVLGQRDLKTYLINFARSFIYTTGLPAEAYQQMYVRATHAELNELRAILQERLGYFRRGLERESSSEVNSPIQIIRFNDVEDLKKVASKLQERKLLSKVIHSPTVPIGMECLRVCLHSFNSFAEIDQLLRILNEAH